MAGKFQPLDRTFAIVDSNGLPTLQFIKWAQERGIGQDDIYVLIEQLQTELDGKADKIIQILAGAGLTGGGDLSVDRTFDVGAGAGITVNANDVAITNTGVTASTYGDATHVPVITVNARGQITNVTLATISGGGGGSVFSTPPGAMANVDTGGNACMGNIIIPKETITISALYGSINNGAIGNVYNMFVATINTGTAAIISTVAATPSITTTATGGQTKKFTFASPVALTPGTAYLLGIVKTSSTTTSPCSLLYSNAALSYPNMPIDAGEMYRLWSSSVRVAAYATNVSSPAAVAAAAGSVGTTATYAVGVLFT